MNSIDFNALKLIKNCKGFKAVKGKTSFGTEVVIISLEPNAEVPLHTTAVDVIFYITKGKIEAEIGEVKNEFSAGTLIESPKDIPHALYNKNNEAAEVIVTKLF